MVEYTTVKKLKVDKKAYLIKGLVISTFFTRVDITSVSTEFPPFDEGENYIIFYSVKVFHELGQSRNIQRTF